MKRAVNRVVTINNNVKPIRLIYSDYETYFGDTTITIYSDYKISLVLTDDCGAVIGDKIFFPKRGDIMIFRPEEVHFGRFPRHSEYRFISALIPVDLFDDVFCANKSILAPFLDSSANKKNLIRVSGEYREKLIGIAENLTQIMKDDSNVQCFDIVAFSKIVEALDICNKFYSEQKDITKEDQLPPLVVKIIKKINAQFPEFSGLTSLAEDCCCSVTYLTQTFRRFMGKSIHNYLTDMRMEHARRLLQDGHSVMEACYKSGFLDCSRFIVLFKKYFGKTPKKYKTEYLS